MIKDGEMLQVQNDVYSKGIMKEEVRSYEVSLWTLQDEFITVLKWSDVEQSGRIEEPQMTLNIDGTQNFTFSIPMYMYVYIEDKQDINHSYMQRVENPNWFHVENKNLIVDLRKIRVIFNKKTENERVFDFLITKVTEEHQDNKLYCRVECEGLAFHELGKIGYKYALSGQMFYDEDYENFSKGIENGPIPNINYWVEKIGLKPLPTNTSEINSRQWYYKVQMDWSSFLGLSEGQMDSSVIYENEYVCNWDNNGRPTKTEATREKTRIVEDTSESNVYNLTQTIAETFGVHCKYEYEYDDNYNIIQRTVIFYNNFLKEAEDVVTFDYPYDSSAITREMDSNDVVTKLFVKSVENNLLSGIDTIMDTPVNRMKEDYIFNFSYLKDIGALSQEQIEDIATFEKEIRKINMPLFKAQKRYRTKSAKLPEKEAYITTYTNSIAEDEEQITSANALYNNLMNKYGVEYDGHSYLQKENSAPDSEILILDREHKRTETSVKTGTYHINLGTNPDFGIVASSIKIYKKYYTLKTSYTENGQEKEDYLIPDDLLPGWKLKKDEHGNPTEITNIKLPLEKEVENSNPKTYTAVENNIVYLTYKYSPKLYYDNIQKTWVKKLNKDKTALINKQKEVYDTITYTITEIDESNESVNVKHVVAINEVNPTQYKVYKDGTEVVGDYTSQVEAYIAALNAAGYSTTITSGTLSIMAPQEDGESPIIIGEFSGYASDPDIITKLRAIPSREVENATLFEIGLKSEITLLEKQCEDYITKKEALIRAFERMLGPAIREGYWLPENYNNFGETFQYNVNDIRNIPVASTNDTEDGYAQFLWDTKLFDDEEKSYYESGILLDKEYYMAIDLDNSGNEESNTIIKATSDNGYNPPDGIKLPNTNNYDTILDLIKAHMDDLSLIYYDCLDYLDDNETTTSPTWTNYQPDNSNLRFISLKGSCELALVRREMVVDGVTVYAPRHVLLVKELKNLSDKQKALLKNNVDDKVHPCFGIVKVNSNTTNVDDTYDVVEYFKIQKSAWIDDEHSRICYPRIKIDSLNLETSSNKLGIKFNNILLEKDADYYVLVRDEYQYITIKPEILYKYYSSSDDNIKVQYTIGNAATAIYLDAIEVAKENAYPKVSYTIQINVINPALIKTLYDRLHQLIMINDVDLKFERVFGYISQVELHLDKPQDDVIEVQNYKTKFEDLFSSIVATTAEMQKNAFSIGTAIAATSNGLSEEVLNSTFVGSGGAALTSFLNSYFDNSEVINNKLATIFDTAGEILGHVNDSLSTLGALSTENAQILSGFSRNIQASLTPKVFNSEAPPSSSKAGDIWINGDRIAVATSPGGWTRTYDGSLAAITGSNLAIDAVAGKITMMAENQINIESGGNIYIAADQMIDIVGNKAVNIGGTQINIISHAPANDVNTLEQNGINLLSVDSATNVQKAARILDKILSHRDYSVSVANDTHFKAVLNAFQNGNYKVETENSFIWYVGDIDLLPAYDNEQYVSKLIADATATIEIPKVVDGQTIFNNGSIVYSTGDNGINGYEIIYNLLKEQLEMKSSVIISPKVVEVVSGRIELAGSSINILTSDENNTSVISMNPDQGIYVGSSKEIRLYSGDISSSSNVLINPSKIIFGATAKIDNQGNNTDVTGSVVEITPKYIVLGTGSSSAIATSNLLETPAITGARFTKETIGFATQNIAEGATSATRTLLQMGKYSETTTVDSQQVTNYYTSILVGTATIEKSGSTWQYKETGGFKGEGSYVEISGDGIYVGSRSNLTLNTNNIKIQSKVNLANQEQMTAFGLGLGLNGDNPQYGLAYVLTQNGNSLDGTLEVKGAIYATSLHINDVDVNEYLTTKTYTKSLSQLKAMTTTTINPNDIWICTDTNPYTYYSCIKQILAKNVTSDNISNHFRTTGYSYIYGTNLVVNPDNGTINIQGNNSVYMASGKTLTIAADNEVKILTNGTVVIGHLTTPFTISKSDDESATINDESVSLVKRSYIYNGTTISSDYNPAVNNFKTGLYLGTDGIYVGNAANDYVKITAAGDVEISGKITANRGYIGGWKISDDALSSVYYVDLNDTSASDWWSKFADLTKYGRLYQGLHAPKRDDEWSLNYSSFAQFYNYTNVFFPPFIDSIMYKQNITALSSLTGLARQNMFNQLIENNQLNLQERFKTYFLNLPTAARKKIHYFNNGATGDASKLNTWQSEYSQTVTGVLTSNWQKHYLNTTFGDSLPLGGLWNPTTTRSITQDYRQYVGSKNNTDKLIFEISFPYDSNETPEDQTVFYVNDEGFLMKEYYIDSSRGKGWYWDIQNNGWVSINGHGQLQATNLKGITSINGHTISFDDGYIRYS